MNRDIFPIPLRIFINCTSLQFTLKYIFSHRGFLCLSWYLSNWETLKNGNVLTEQAGRIQIILFLPLCGNNVNIYRSGKLSGVFNKWEPNHSLCADAISGFDLTIHQVGAVAPRRLIKPVSYTQAKFVGFFLLKLQESRSKVQSHARAPLFTTCDKTDT